MDALRTTTYNENKDQRRLSAKDDLQTFGTLRGDIEKSETALRSDLQKMEAGIRHSMAMFETGVRHSMWRFETGVRRSMAEMEVDLRDEIRKLGIGMDAEFNRLSWCILLGVGGMTVTVTGILTLVILFAPAK